MKIDSVKLRNFRNYEKASVDLDSGMNLITGHNAQGKTNFLEALVYLSLTRSHRVNDDRLMIRNGQEAAEISCIYEDEIQKDLEAVIHSKGKTLMIHHQPVKKASEFIGLLNIVLFSPDDLTVFHDSPARRRKIMNQEISRVSSRYLLSLNHFQSLLKDRNLLLKQEQMNRTLLETLNEEMSREEALITAERRQFIEKIDEKLNSYYQMMSGDEKTNLRLHYACAFSEMQADQICEAHQRAEEKDFFYRTTTCGIHREDMNFEMNGQNVSEYASQGQKRMAVLSFKLSLLQYIEGRTGKKPVLLLDDVLSELDEIRQDRLINLVKEPYQCIITAAEVPACLKNKKTTMFHVEKGTIERTGGTADE